MMTVRHLRSSTIAFVILALGTACSHSNKVQKPDILVTIQPTTANLSVGEVFQFTASVTDARNDGGATATTALDTSVSWQTIEGAAGGTISEVGLYTAPETPGTFHVRATSHADPSKYAEATVTVSPVNPELVAVIQITDNDPAYANAKYFPALPGYSPTQGYAPYPVFFEGWQSRPRANIARYEWDFGPKTESDEMGRFFEGFNAAHVFEQPGDHEVTLRVTDISGAQNSAKVTIHIEQRPGTAYYVDSAVGDDSNDGTQQTVGGGHGPWKTATKALLTLSRKSGVALKPGDSVLFKRGQTFDLGGTMTYVDPNNGVSALLTLSHGDAVQGVLYGAYGDAGQPKPLIRWSGDAQKDPSGTVWSSYLFVAPGIGGAYIALADLEFSFLNEANGTQISGMFFIPSGWKNLMLLRTTVHDSQSGLFSMEGIAPAPCGIFVVSCHVDNNKSALLGSTQMYGAPSRLALLNSTFDNAGNHTAYFTAMSKGVISKNNFSRPAFGRTALRIAGGPDGPETSANNIVISDNRFLGWVDPLTGGTGRGGGSHNGGGTRYHYKLINFGPNGQDKNMVHDWIVFERNVITNFEVGMDVNASSNFYVRNNLFETPVGGTALTLNPDQSAAIAPLTNVYVYGNTFLIGSRTLDPQNPNGNTAIVRIAPYTRTDKTTFGSADTNVEFSNNIVATSEIGSAKVALEMTAAIPGLSQKNNLYYMPKLVNGPFLKLAAKTMSLAAWQEAQLDSGSKEGDPAWANGKITADFNDGAPSAMDVVIGEADKLIQALKIGQGSAAQGAGIDLGAALHYDFLRAVRPATPDIGAFQVQAAH